MSVPVCGVRSPLTYTKSRTLIWENGRRLKSITDESGSLLSMEYGGIMYYYGKNLQGDILRLVDGNGKTAAEYEYDSWGRLTAVKGENGEDIRNEAGHIGNINPFRYRGYYYDSETGFYYLGSRYYDPEVGRFISADTTDILGASGNLYDKNLYAYCDNNPIVRADSNGTMWIHLVIGAAIGVGIQFTMDVGIGMASGKSFDEVVHSLSPVDYVSAAIGGALAASGIGEAGSVIANAALGGATYLANCSYNEVKPNAGDLLLATAIGGLAGKIGGKGVNGKNMPGVYRYSKQVINTTKSARKQAMYMAKIIGIRKAIVGGCKTATAAGAFSNIFNLFRKRLTRSKA